jgi:hypothetical protein
MPIGYVHKTPDNALGYYMRLFGVERIFIFALLVTKVTPTFPMVAPSTGSESVDPAINALASSPRIFHRRTAKQFFGMVRCKNDVTVDTKAKQKQISQVVWPAQEGHPDSGRLISGQA